MTKKDRVVLAGVLAYLVIEKPRLTENLLQVFFEALRKKDKNGFE